MTGQYLLFTCHLWNIGFLYIIELQTSQNASVCLFVKHIIKIDGYKNNE